MSYTVAKIKEDDFSFSKKGTERTYSVKYLIESTTVNDRNFLAASLASGMPQEGDKYDYDSGVFVSDISLDEVVFHASSTTFNFSVNYSTASGSTTSEAASNPLSAPPKISFGNARYQAPFTLAYDETGEYMTKPVLNSAGMPFDPPAIREYVNTLINIQYNTRTFSGSWVRQFTNKINKNSISVAGISIAEKCGRINELGASNNFDEDGREYWTVNITIEASTEEFTHQLLDSGLMALNNNGDLDSIYVETDEANNASYIRMKSDISGLKQKLKDGTVAPVSEPKNLDGHGKILAEGEDPVYLEFKGYYAIDWGTLNIPKTRNTASNQLGGLAI